MVFQNLAKIEMTRNKNQLFGRHFETVQHFNFFFFFFLQNCGFYDPYIYGANFIAKIPVGKWFSQGGSMEPPPWALTGVKEPWSLKC